MFAGVQGLVREVEAAPVGFVADLAVEEVALVDLVVGDGAGPTDGLVAASGGMVGGFGACRSEVPPDSCLAQEGRRNQFALVVVDVVGDLGRETFRGRHDGSVRSASGDGLVERNEGGGEVVMKSS